MNKSPKVQLLIRQARRQSGFTLRLLASLSKTSHSTIAAYEQGSKAPSADVLLRLIAACRLELLPTKARGTPSDHLEAKGRELEAVLDLAGEFPARHKANPGYPIFGIAYGQPD